MIFLSVDQFRRHLLSHFFFFFNDTATTEIYTLSLHDALPILVGAYKAILVRNLEVETLVPPLDLYLNKRLAEFENRLAQPNLRVLVDTSRLKIFRRFRK